MEFNEAIDKVLALKDKVGSMPNHEDYERFGIDTEELAEALGIDLAFNNKTLGTRPYAAINIAVIRELRRRENQPIRIVTPTLF